MCATSFLCVQSNVQRNDTFSKTGVYLNVLFIVFTEVAPEDYRELLLFG